MSGYNFQDIARLVEKQFKEQEYELNNFCSEFKTQLIKLLEYEKIECVLPVAGRVKEYDSYINKISSGRFQFNSDIKELNDLVGLRIVLLYNSDVEAVVKLINENCEIIKQQNKVDELKSNEFGYSSYHLDTKLSPDWLKTPSLRKYADYQAEIQVRTISQHAWAVFSHKYSYKDRNGIPPVLIRNINRLSAILEIVDSEFESIKHERIKYARDSESVNSETLLNVDNLKIILGENFPRDNNDIGVDYTSLLDQLRFFGYDTVGKLREIIDNNKVEIGKKEKELIKIVKLQLENDPESNDISNIQKDNFNKGIYFSHSGIVGWLLIFTQGLDWYQRYYLK